MEKFGPFGGTRRPRAAFGSGPRAQWAACGANSARRPASNAALRAHLLTDVQLARANRVLALTLGPLTVCAVHCAGCIHCIHCIGCIHCSLRPVAHRSLHTAHCSLPHTVCGVTR